MSSVEVARLFARFDLDTEEAVKSVGKAVREMVAFDKALAAVDSTSNRLQRDIAGTSKSVADANRALAAAAAAVSRYDDALNAAALAADAFDEANKEVVTGLSRAVKAGQNITQTYFYASSVVRDLAGAFGTLFNAASEGAKINAAQQFFENSGKSLNDLRNATRGMIADAELMRKANLADSMGISQDVFKKLAQVAEASALKTGQSFDYMFESIIVGTARSSRLLLDNLGIIVSVDQANEKYAKSALEAAGATDIGSKAVNKFVEEMSAEEKQMAFVQEVARKSKGTIDEYGKTTDRTAEAFARAEAALANFSDTIKRALASSLGGGGFLGWLTKTVQGLSLVAEGLDKISMSDVFTKGLAVAATEAGSKARQERYAKDAASRDALMAEVDSSKARLIQMSGSSDPFFREFAKNVRWTDDGLVELSKSAAELRQNGIDATNTALVAFADELKNFAATRTKLGDPRYSAGDQLPPHTKPPKTAEELAKEDKKREDAIRDSLADYNRDLNNTMDSFWDTVVKNEKAAAKAAEDAAKAAATAEKNRFDESVRQTKAYWDAWDDQIKANKKAAEEAAKLAAEAAKLYEDNARQREREQREIAGGLTEQIGSGGGIFGPISGVVGPAVGAAVGGPIGGIIGGLITVIGPLIDALKPVTDLIGGLMDGLTLFVKNGLGEILSSLGTLAQPLTMLLASLGAALGGVLRVLVPVVTVLVAAVSWIMNFFSGFAVLMAGFWSVFGEITVWGKGMTEVMDSFELSLRKGSAAFVDTLVWLNNTMIDVMRSLMGNDKLGKKLKRSDFQIDRDVTEENTDATVENTEAVRDLAREFRNLPQFYKAQGTMFAVQDAERPRIRWGAAETLDRGNRAYMGGRWRT